jgi:hypothetical protein
LFVFAQSKEFEDATISIGEKTIYITLLFLNGCGTYNSKIIKSKKKKKERFFFGGGGGGGEEKVEFRHLFSLQKRFSLRSSDKI